MQAHLATIGCNGQEISRAHLATIGCNGLNFPWGPWVKSMTFTSFPSRHAPPKVRTTKSKHSGNELPVLWVTGTVGANKSLRSGFVLGSFYGMNHSFPFVQNRPFQLRHNGMQYT